MNTSLVIITIIALSIGGYFVFIYNSIVGTLTQSKKEKIDLELNFKKRYDLVADLVSLMRDHLTKNLAVSSDQVAVEVIETNSLDIKKCIEQLVTARNLAVNAVEDHEANNIRAQREISISQALKDAVEHGSHDSLFSTNPRFLTLQHEIVDVERKVNGAWKTYNDTVKAYNQSLNVLPVKMIAQLFKFGLLEALEG